MLGCLLSFVSCDWTCQSCEEAIQVGIEISTSENVLEAEAELVAAGICVNTTDDAACKDFVPDFWKAIAREMYPGAWGHLCDDIADTCEEHGPPRPSCEACSLRVKWMVEYLKDPAIMNYWVETLRSGSFCTVNYFGLEDLCVQYLDLFCAEMITLTANNLYVDAWCIDQFGCV